MALLLGSLGVLAALAVGGLRFVQGNWAVFAVDIAAAGALAGVLARIARHGASSGVRLVMVVSYLSAVVIATYLTPLESVLWAYPCMAATYFLLTARRSLATNTPAYILILAAVWEPAEPARLLGIALSLALTNIIALFFAAQNRSQREQLDGLASRDPLTGVFNRRALERDLTAAVQAHARSGAGAGLVLFDIDHFKGINDACGHEAGDEVLREVVRRTVSVVRPADRLYRFGGEEFVLLTSTETEAETRAVAEKVRQAVCAAAMAPRERVSISAGVSAVAGHASAQAWLAAADMAMYQAKRDGRDRVRAASDLWGGAGPATAGA